MKQDVKMIVPLNDNALAELRLIFAQERQEDKVRCTLLTMADNLSNSGNTEASRRSGYLQKNLEDLVETYYLEIPLWEDRALQYATEQGHGIDKQLEDALEQDGIWRKSTLDKGNKTVRDFPKRSTTNQEYVIKGKIYTQEEVSAIYDFWHNRLERKELKEAIETVIDLESESDPNFVQWIGNNIDEAILKVSEAKQQDSMFNQFLTYGTEDDSLINLASIVLHDLYSHQKEIKNDLL